MLSLLMITFAAAFMKELIKVHELPIPLIRNRQVKQISNFRYGYVNLLHDLWTNVKNISVMSK